MNLPLSGYLDHSKSKYIEIEIIAVILVCACARTFKINWFVCLKIHLLPYSIEVHQEGTLSNTPGTIQIKNSNIHINFREKKIIIT